MIEILGKSINYCDSFRGYFYGPSIECPEEEGYFKIRAAQFAIVRACGINEQCGLSQVSLTNASFP